MQEIKVGKWIDGKDIYRKVIKGVVPKYNPNNEYGGVNVYNVGNGIDTVVHHRGFVIGNKNTTNDDFNTFECPNFTKKEYLTVCINTIQNRTDNNKCTIGVFNNYPLTDKVYEGCTIYIIVEYTLV